MTSYGYDLALVPAGTVVTATGVGQAFQVTDKDQFRGVSTISAISGTSPSITVSVQTSNDNGVTDPWRTVGSFPAQTTVASSAHQDFVGLDVWIRASWTVSGTSPSVTFGVAGEAV